MYFKYIYIYILICRERQVSRSSSMYIIALTATPRAWASMLGHERKSYTLFEC